MVRDVLMPVSASDLVRKSKQVLCVCVYLAVTRVKFHHIVIWIDWLWRDPSLFSFSEMNSNGTTPTPDPDEEHREFAMDLFIVVVCLSAVPLSRDPSSSNQGIHRKSLIGDYSAEVDDVWIYQAV